MISTKIVLIFVMAIGSFLVLNDVFYNKEADYGDSFHALPEKSIDVIALGSSHLQYSFIPSQIYAQTGLTSYVLGSGCQSYRISYQMLREALKTQDPKLVVLEVYMALPLKPGCEGDGCYVLAEYQMTGEEKIATIDMMEDREKASEYYFDFLNYHNDWKTVESLSDLVPRSKKEKNIDQSFGYHFWDEEHTYNNYWRPNHVTSSLNSAVLNEEDSDSLNKIKELCAEKGIELLLYMAPMDGLDEENLSYLKAVWDWAAENEVPYVDFTQLAEEMDLYMNIHCDSFHSYLTGAMMMSTVLSEKISEYGFEHQINDDHLDELYATDQRDLLIRYLKRENRPVTYLRALKGAAGVTLIRYRYQGSVNKEIVGLLNELGLEHFNGYQNVSVVIVDGEVVASDVQISDLVVGDDHLFLLDEGFLINGTYYGSDYCGLMVGYFDPLTKEAIAKKVVTLKGNICWDKNAFVYDRDID